ncbi:MAG: hypothetical protein DRQ78_06805 [Epsilonproteobacteria bacterium]|nr:MAG: hypothetical protein DRQ78_06805 [Campylobacterota bacterium]
MYSFDPALKAKSVFKERFVWMLFMAITFFLLYGAANQYAGITAPHLSFWMEWEKKIPFVPVFIVPYMSSDLMFVIAFLLPYTRLELRVLAVRVLFIVIVSVIFFLIFPLQFSFEKPVIDSYTFLFSLLEADLPYNQAPSLHIAFAIILWVSMRKYLHNIWLRVLVPMWLWLIALSTLLVYQHHFIDLPLGAFVALAGIYFFDEDRISVWTKSFSTPRSLKMGLYYLITASIFMILAFVWQSFTYLFLWFFLSLFSVSIVYAFGLNNFLAGKDAKAKHWQYFLFAPYFVGNYVSWQYYKRKIPLFVAVDKNIYFGRFPSKNEYQILKKQGIKHCVNLATEQQVQKQIIAQTRLAFLDQTIQSPESLHEAVLLIEKYKKELVYVHCALGLSRSVLVLSAWLLYKGKTVEEVEKTMIKIRPLYVKSAYMSINLEMYKTWLERKV